MTLHHRPCERDDYTACNSPTNFRAARTANPTSKVLCSTETRHGTWGGRRDIRMDPFLSIAGRLHSQTFLLHGPSGSLQQVGWREVQGGRYAHVVGPALKHSLQAAMAGKRTHFHSATETSAPRVPADGKRASKRNTILLLRFHMSMPCRK
jgi:hypothetical protein